MNLLHRNVYPLIVFLTGAAVLVIEIAATRILAPWFGNTIFTFSSVISVILAALAIGYYLGGRLCDRWPSPRMFFITITLSGVSVYLCQLLANLLLPAFAPQLSIMTGPLLLSLLMFFIPGALLGMLSPWAIKLHSVLNPAEGIGSASGKIFFWSTLGSIIGSLGTGFLLIPRFGLESIMIGSATMLSLLGIAGFLTTSRPRPGVFLLPPLVIATAFAAWVTSPRPQPGLLYKHNGIYELLTVRNTIFNGRPARILQQDRTVSGLLYLDKNETLDYVKFPILAPLFQSEIRHALAIGGGTYLLPRTMLDNYPNATVDVAEIEPGLLSIGQQYFDIPATPRLRNHVTDGRMFLARSGQAYDIIFADIYYGMTTPSHFTTREYHQLVKSRLSPGGIYMANLVGDLDASRPNIVLSQMRVIREVFPHSEFIATVSPTSTETQSIVAIARNSEEPLALDTPEIQTNPNPLVRNLSSMRINTANINWEKSEIFTDDFAPAEYYATFSLARELSS